MTPVGTITHELGHLFVAKALGYETILHYSSVSWNNELVEKSWKRYEVFKSEINNKISIEGHEKHKKDIEILDKHSLLICLAGISQTIIFGLIAFMILFYRIFIKKDKFIWLHWMLSFISLFLLREVFNLITGLIRGFYLKNNIYFYGDEAKIANILGLYEGIILIPLGVISLIICLSVLKLIPKIRRKEYILSAIIGCPIGYILWMFLIGPLVLP